MILLELAPTSSEKHILLSKVQWGSILNQKVLELTKEELPIASLEDWGYVWSAFHQVSTVQGNHLEDFAMYKLGMIHSKSMKKPELQLEAGSLTQEGLRHREHLTLSNQV